MRTRWGKKQAFVKRNHQERERKSSSRSISDPSSSKLRFSLVPFAVDANPLNRPRVQHGDGHLSVKKVVLMFEHVQGADLRLLLSLIESGLLCSLCYFHYHIRARAHVVGSTPKPPWRLIRALSRRFVVLGRIQGRVAMNLCCSLMHDDVMGIGVYPLMEEVIECALERYQRAQDVVCGEAVCRSLTE